MTSDTLTIPGGGVGGLTFGAWLFPGDVLQTVEVSITSSEFGGTTYFDQVVSFTQSGCSGNQYGFNICTESGSLTTGNLAGGTYWVNLSNAVVNNGDPVYWDENSGVGCGSSGCPSLASETSVGTIPSEAFTVDGICESCAPPCFHEQPQNGFQVIHDFTGGADGRYQYSGVTIDKAANLYGIDCDTDLCLGGLDLYKLSRAGQNWTLTALYDGGSVGNTVGPDGSLYGASGYYDDVFKLGPSPTACLAGLCPWIRTELYHFTGNNDASGATGILTFDPAGNLYGTSILGGGGNCNNGAGCGTVYELTPSIGGWTEKVLYAWQGDGDSQGAAALLVGVDGNLYGRTFGGGDYGYGTVYQLAPSNNGWTQTVIYRFPYPQGLPENQIASTALLQDSAGNLYGIASEGGGGFPHGIIFMLSPNNGSWVFTILRDNYDSGDLFNNLAIDAAGNLYGTGGLGVSFGCGERDWCFAYIFELLHKSDGWQFSTPIYFSGEYFEVWGNVALDASGNLYGTTVTCGRYDYGTVWEFSP